MLGKPALRSSFLLVNLSTQQSKTSWWHLWHQCPLTSGELHRKRTYLTYSQQYLQQAPFTTHSPSVFRGFSSLANPCHVLWCYSTREFHNARRDFTHTDDQTDYVVPTEQNLPNLPFLPCLNILHFHNQSRSLQRGGPETTVVFARQLPPTDHNYVGSSASPQRWNAKKLWC